MQLNFDARRVAPSTAPEPVETGTYPVIIKAAQEKPTKNQDGTFVELTLEVMHGPAAGKRIIDRLNLGNKNPQAVEIAYGQLSAICHVTGRMQIQSEQQLVGATMQVYVVKEPRVDAPGQYGNAVKGYKDMQGNDPGQAGAHGNMGGAQQGGQQFGGAQQGQGFGGQQQDPNAGQNFGGGQQFNGQGGGQQFDPNAGQANGYNPNQQGQNFGGGQQQGNGQNFGGGNGYNPNQGGQQFDPNAGQGQQFGGGQQGQNFGGAQQGGGYNPNQGGGAGGPAGNGNAPSWA